jgi:glycosyltransferase involved in cell wall biosynthesis
MDQKQILYIHPSNELYGADRVLLRLVRDLDKQKYAPHVIVANDLQYEGLLTDQLAAAGIQNAELNLGVLRRKYQTPQGLGLFSYRTVQSSRKMLTYCTDNGIDLIHTNSTAVLSGGPTARRAKLPHIWHVHEIITKPSWLNQLIAGTLHRYADMVIAVSGPVRDHLLAAKPALENKVVVVHNGIDPEKFLNVSPRDVDRLRKSWGANSDSIIVGMVGRISEWKGQEFLLEAVRRVVEAENKAHIVIVGGTVPGEEQRVIELQRKVDASGLAERVFIDNFRLDIPAVLAAFDIFVLPSIRPDPFPTVVLEAMASGKPVVATAHGGAIEQVVDGETGYLVSPASTAEMEDALKKLVRNSAEREHMGRAGQERLMKNFTTERFVQDIEQLYGQVLTKWNQNATTN